MPELPDVTLYCERLEALAGGSVLAGVRLQSPFLLRTVQPPLTAAANRRLLGVERLGKRIVLALAGELFLVIHLMIAGRLRWRTPGAAIPGRDGLCAFDFDAGSLLLTEASKKRRASLHVLAGRDALAAHHTPGLEPLEASAEAFEATLLRENRTLKRALTDPRLFSGIGNAYSDEILFEARLSPMKLTSRLDPGERRRLFEATRAVLNRFTEHLRAEVGEGFPEKVTAFRDDMAVHGRHRQPCVRCGAEIQRILYAENECDYCAACQNQGRLLADRALSQLLKKDWPRTLEELELARSVGPSRGRR
ncbi:MAG: DNA-formamidopyrimidine glycosylase family protein [Pseudomonadota bacterium]